MARYFPANAAKLIFFGTSMIICHSSKPGSPIKFLRSKTEEDSDISTSSVDRMPYEDSMEAKAYQIRPYSELPEIIGQDYIKNATISKSIDNEGDARLILKIPVQDKQPDGCFLFYLSTGTSNKINFPLTFFPIAKNEIEPCWIRKVGDEHKEYRTLTDEEKEKFEYGYPKWRKAYMKEDDETLAIVCKKAFYGYHKLKRGIFSSCRKPNFTYKQLRWDAFFNKMGSWQALQISSCYGGVWDEDDFVEMKYIIQNYDYVPSRQVSGWDPKKVGTKNIWNKVQRLLGRRKDKWNRDALPKLDQYLGKLCLTRRKNPIKDRSSSVKKKIQELQYFW